YVFSAALDITWLFYGLEKFKFVAIRNALVKILETICIFAFIKSPEDIGIYTFIMCCSVCSGQIVVMPQVVGEIPPLKVSFSDLKEHIKPLFTLFAAVIAVTLYTVFDKTLLGILSTRDDVAFYEYSDKIVKIPRSFIVVIGNVLFPRACRYAANRDMKSLEKNFCYCLTITCIIGFASAFGLSAVADLFAVLYYGESFRVCGNVIVCMCPLILIIGFGEAVRQSYIYPLKMDAVMVKILSVNAVVNLILSAVLIPSFGIYGAVVGTICAETVGLIAEMWICRKYLSLRTILSSSVPFALFGLIMYVCVRMVAHYYDGTLAALVLQILVGAFVYIFWAFLYSYFGNSMTRGLLNNIISAVKARFRKAGKN
ncbi:MAG: polysaccharide biosynthesis C-terminal domain-containing protein, partial [Candidatus Gastranaerophilales bacterium]|nr:polysaccharide biosynthesis C-terminal domain-containing protein [Candidatus Gastranaerophilales bacterium]